MCLLSLGLLSQVRLAIISEHEKLSAGLLRQGEYLADHSRLSRTSQDWMRTRMGFRFTTNPSKAANPEKWCYMTPVPSYCDKIIQLITFALEIGTRDEGRAK